MRVDGIPVDKETKLRWVLDLRAPVHALKAGLVEQGSESLLEDGASVRIGIQRDAGLEGEDCDFGDGCHGCDGACFAVLSVLLVGVQCIVCEKELWGARWDCG